MILGGIVWIFGFCNIFGITQMARLLSKLKKYWSIRNLHQWHFYNKSTGLYTRNWTVALKKNYQYVSVKMGRDFFQIRFIIGQVSLNSFNCLDDRLIFLQQTAKNKVCKLFGEYDHKSKW